MNRRSRAQQSRKLCLQPLERRTLLAAEISLGLSIDEIADPIAPGPSFPLGQDLKLSYAVTNTGDQPVRSPRVTDAGLDTSDPLDDFVPTPLLRASEVTSHAPVTLVQTKAAQFLMHPTLPYAFASLPSTNSVAIINTETLSVEHDLFVGSIPGEMALSLDGGTLFVANRGSTQIGRVDLSTRELLSPLSLGDATPIDIEVGADGRLYVLTSDALIQIDPNTGESVGPVIEHFTYSGRLEISPGKDRLYYGDFGLSPASLKQFDVTQDPPELLWESPHGGLSGSNGQDLDLSEDGRWISYACGAGQGGYQIAKYRTSDMAIEGMFVTGAYPREVAYGPDAAFVYTVNDRSSIDVWETEQFQKVGFFSTTDEANEIAVSLDGATLFASFEGAVVAYSTGRVADVNQGDENENRVLDPGETWLYESTTTALKGTRQRLAKAAVIGGVGGTVYADAVAYYSGVGAAFEVVHSVDGVVFDPSSETETAFPRVAADNELLFRYTLTNSGTYDLTDVQIEVAEAGQADSGAPLVDGDVNQDGRFNPNEVWTFELPVTALADQRNLISVVSATAVDTQGNPIQDQPQAVTLTSGYFGIVSAFSVTVTANGRDASSDPPPAIRRADAIDWVYQVTNTGNVPLSGVEPFDRGDSAEPSDDLFPEPVPHSIIPASFGSLESVVDGVDVARIIVDPDGRWVFASDSSGNQVIVINPITLEVVKRVNVGSAPTGMAVSLDGKDLYVANRTSDFISVIDLDQMRETRRIELPEPAFDLEFASPDRLFILTDAIVLIDTDGKELRRFAERSVHGGQLEINSERTRLYYADTGYSPASLYQFDISADSPVQLWESPHGGLSGSNGQDLELSHDGEFISYPAGAGQGGYRIAKYSTDGMSIEGSFDTGAYPREITFSPDDAVAYTVNTRYAIDQWNTRTFLKQGTMRVTDEAYELKTDPSGQYLFAAFENQLRVYGTGRFRIGLIDGDTNWNSRLDPGETWSYTAQQDLHEDSETHAVVVTALSSTGQTITVETQARFAKRVDVSVDERVSGRTLLAEFPELQFQLSDERFEIVDGELRLKAGRYLLRSEDNEAGVWISSETDASWEAMMVSLQVNENATPWHNPVNRVDANGSGSVSVIDALVVINWIYRQQPGDELVRPADAQYFLDTNADGNITPSDALLVINTIARTAMAPTPDGEDVQWSSAKVDDALALLF